MFNPSRNSYTRKTNSIKAPRARRALFATATAAAASLAPIASANFATRSLTWVAQPTPGSTALAVELHKTGPNGDPVTIYGHLADGFGAATATIPDWNADGIPDAAIGSPLADENGANSGSLLIVSGADGAQLFELRGTSGAMLGRAARWIGDFDGNGNPDLAVASVTIDDAGLAFGRVDIVDTQTLSVIASFVGARPDDQFGIAIAAPGDVNGDGFADVAISATGPAGIGWPAGIEPGAVYVFFGAAPAQAIDIRTASQADLALPDPDHGTRLFATALGRGLDHQGEPTIVTVSLRADGANTRFDFERWSLTTGAQLAFDQSTIAPGLSPVAGDADNDLAVSTDDVIATLDSFGASTGTQVQAFSADFDANGIVDASDLSITLTHLDAWSPLLGWVADADEFLTDYHGLRRTAFFRTLHPAGATYSDSVVAHAQRSFEGSVTNCNGQSIPCTNPGGCRVLCARVPGQGGNAAGAVGDALDAGGTDATLEFCTPRYPRFQTVFDEQPSHDDSGATDPTDAGQDDPLVVLVRINTADNDLDGIPGWADGADLDPNNPADDSDPGAILVPVQLSFPAGAGDPCNADDLPASTQIRFDYDGPTEVSVGEPPQYDRDCEALRLWRTEGHRDHRDVAEGGDFIQPGTWYTLEEIGGAPLMVYVEAIHTSSCGDIDAWETARVTVTHRHSNPASSEGDTDASQTFYAFPWDAKVIEEGDATASVSVPMSEWLPELEAEITHFAVTEEGDVELTIAGHYRDQLAELLPSNSHQSFVEVLLNGEIVAVVQADAQPDDSPWRIQSLSTPFNVTVTAPVFSVSQASPREWGRAAQVEVRTASNAAQRRSSHSFVAPLEFIWEHQDGFGNQPFITFDGPHDPENPPAQVGVRTGEITRLTPRGKIGGGAEPRMLVFYGLPPELEASVTTQHGTELPLISHDSFGPTTLTLGRPDGSGPIVLAPSSDLATASDDLLAAWLAAGSTIETVDRLELSFRLNRDGQTVSAGETVLYTEIFPYTTGSDVVEPSPLPRGSDLDFDAKRAEILRYFHLLFDYDERGERDNYGTFLLEDIYRATWAESRDGFVSDNVQNGNLIVLRDFNDWFYWSNSALRRPNSSRDFQIIELDSSVDSVTLAVELRERLGLSLPGPAGIQAVLDDIVWEDANDLNPQRAVEEWSGTRGRVAASAAAPLANAYLSGILLVAGPGAEFVDFVFSVGELSKGNTQALVGVLPAVPSGASVSLKIGSGAGAFTAITIAGSRLNAFVRGISAVEALGRKDYFTKRIAEMTNAGMAPEEISTLITATRGYDNFEQATSRSGLTLKLDHFGGNMRRAHLERRLKEFEPDDESFPAGTPMVDRILAEKELSQTSSMWPAGTKMQVHHELPWKFAHVFAKFLFDVNHPQYAKCVFLPDGGNPTLRHHGTWSYEYNREWEFLFFGEGGAADPGGGLLDLYQNGTISFAQAQQQIRDKLLDMRAQFEPGQLYPAIPEQIM